MMPCHEPSFTGASEAKGAPVRIRKLTAISIQTEEAVVLKAYKGDGDVRCKQCVAPSRMVTAEEAARLFRLPIRQVYRLIEVGQLHFEDAAGRVLVCLESLRTTASRLPAEHSSEIKSKENQS